MYIKTKVEFNLIKLDQKKNATSGKTHNYISVMDLDKNPHKFYVGPSLAEKIKTYEYLAPIGLDIVVVYGTQNKEFDGLQIKNVYNPKIK